MIDSTSSPSQYRYDTVKEYAADLKALSKQYHTKIKKYRRRITIIDVTVYSVSGIMAGADVILSSVTMIAPVAIPIAVSAVTTVAEIASAITKKLSSCLQTKLHEYTSKYTIANDSYSQLSTMIWTTIDDALITDAEFSPMTSVYNSAMSKLVIENNFNNNNDKNNNGETARTTSTNSGKYHSDANKYDINNLNES